MTLDNFTRQWGALRGLRVNNLIYYIGKLVGDEKENSDWFFEWSEFYNTGPSCSKAD